MSWRRNSLRRSKRCLPDLVSPDEAHHHERLRIARDLHDTLAQSLAGIGYAMDTVIADESLKDSTRRQLRSIRVELSDLLVELRDEILILREPNVSSMESWLRSRLGLDFSWQRIASNQNLERSGVEVAHLLLELLNNAISHQGINKAEIMESADSIRIRFTPTASRAVTEGTTARVRLGRVGIAERLELLEIDLTESETGFILRWR